MEEDRDTDGENRGREQRGNLYCPDSRIGERGLGRDDYFTLICQMFGWQATISVNSVIGIHFLTSKDFSLSFIIMEQV